MTGLTAESFGSLPPDQQRRLAMKALAWFCVMDTLNPYFSTANPTESAVIKIIVGKFMNEGVTGK